MERRFSIQTIGRLRTPFPEKFGIPRQAGLVDLPGTIEMIPPFDELAFFEGLEAVSHLWITFVFHLNRETGWRGRVRPPRLGGNRRLGVFATRSPFRPNHLGLSVVRLHGIQSHKGRKVVLKVSGVDMVDGTPVVDVKPYLPYADALPRAQAGYAGSAPRPRLEVAFTPELAARIEALQEGDELADAVRAVIALDPRPAYRAESDRDQTYGLALYRWDFRWRMDANGRALVFAMTPRTSGQ